MSIKYETILNDYMPPSIQKTQKAECCNCNEKKDCKLTYFSDTGKQFVCKDCFSTSFDESTWKKIKTDGSI